MRNCAPDNISQGLFMDEQCGKNGYWQSLVLWFVVLVALTVALLFFGSPALDVDVTALGQPGAVIECLPQTVSFR